MPGASRRDRSPRVILQKCSRGVLPRGDDGRRGCATPPVPARHSSQPDGASTRQAPPRTHPARDHGAGGRNGRRIRTAPGRRIDLAPPFGNGDVRGHPVRRPTPRRGLRFGFRLGLGPPRASIDDRRQTALRRVDRAGVEHHRRRRSLPRRRLRRRARNPRQPLPPRYHLLRQNPNAAPTISRTRKRAPPMPRPP